jgi:hypothetical protein
MQLRRIVTPKKEGIMSRNEKQSRRWIVVINNAFFTDDDKDEISLYEQYINIQKEEPTTWRAFLRRIHGVYRFDNPTDREKLMTVLQDVDTTDEPYDPQIVAQIRRAAEIELIPVADDNLPW